MKRNYPASLLLANYHLTSIVKMSLVKPPDTVGEPPSTENCASHMPLLKGQEPGESNAAIAAVLRGNRLANSITTVFETVEKLVLVTKLSQGNRI
jgi:hypothetical protein